MKWYTAKEACFLLRISNTTLYRLEKRGELIPYRIGRLKRYSQDEIKEYMERNQTV